MVILRTIIVISANSWLGVWIGLEINLIAIIPILVSNSNLNNTEAALNYFLVQAFASTTLLFSIIIILIINNLIFTNFLLIYNIPIKLILLSIIIKLGAPPFHFWFPNVIENCRWNNAIILITWQKIGPIVILIYFLKINNILIIFIIIATLIGAIGGLNQTSLRKIIAFSSINHLGWIFIAIIFNENIWFIYFAIYSFLILCLILLFKMIKIFYLNQIYTVFIYRPTLKFLFIRSLLSLGGLPPFLGFLPKWLIIQSLRSIRLNFIGLFLICIRLITLFYYLKIRFSAFIFNYSEYNYFYRNFLSNKIIAFLLTINIISLFRFLLIIDLLYNII